MGRLGKLDNFLICICDLHNFKLRLNDKLMKDFHKIGETRRLLIIMNYCISMCMSHSLKFQEKNQDTPK